MSENKPFTYWKDGNKLESDIWKTGFQPSDILTNVGSGGSTCGHIADILNLDRGAPVSLLGSAFYGVQIRPADILGNWKVYVLDIPEPMIIHDKVLTTAGKLQNIRDIFGLSISHLAQILCASRPSVHSWLEGKEPRDQSVERIDDIYRYALNWKEMSPYHYSPGRLMRQPLGKGISMMERLESVKLSKLEIQEGFKRLLELMQRQREQMDHAKQSNIKSISSINEKNRTRHDLTSTVYSENE